MVGARRPNQTRFRDLRPGDYSRWDGPGEVVAWHFRTPGGQGGILDALSPHSVVEHEDGTITVTPSILQPNSPDGWHGFLERGVWREC